MADIGKAYVQIEPTAKGISGKIEKEFGSIGKSSGSAFSGGFASVLGGAAGAVGNTVATLGKVALGAVAAGSAAVAGVVKTATDSYGEYEQLVGGVETLFGNSGKSLQQFAIENKMSLEDAHKEWGKFEKAQQTVLNNANNAYKTAGMSTNEYMQTVTSFAAALNASLEGDTVASAQKADMAITDMSDNANKMGSSMESIQNAYQGFAKQNYTMLDNLKLGYGGTKEEMQRLLNDAEKLSGQKFDLSSYADIVDAIHVVQTEMGITGTTAKEASTTIQGSLGMVQAAWANLMTGMGDGEADLDTLMSNLVNSIVGYTDEAGVHINGLLDNILPVIETAMGSVGTLIGKIAPVLAEKVPSLISEILPSLLEAGANVVAALIQGITENINQLLFIAGDIIESLLNGLLEATSSGESTIMGIIEAILGVFEENYMQFIDVGLQILHNIFEGFVNSLPEILYYAQEIILHLVDAIIQNLPSLMETAFQMILYLAEGIAQALPELIPKAIEAIITFATSLIENIDLLIDAAIALIMGLAEGLINALPILIEKAPEIIIKLVEAILENLPKIWDAAIQLITKLSQGILAAIPQVVTAILNLVQRLFETLRSKGPEFLSKGKEMIQKVCEGIKQMITNAKSAINDVLTAIKGKFTEWFDKAKTWGKDMIQNFIDGIKSMIGKVGDAVSGIADKIKGLIGFSEPDEGPLSNFHTFAPDMIDLFVSGLKKGESLVKAQMAETFGMPTINPSMEAISNYEPANTTESKVLAILNQYLPIIAQGENITVGLEPDSARFFKMMQYEQQRNAQLVGV